MEMTGIRMQISEVVKENEIGFSEISPEHFKRIYRKVLKIFSGMPDPRVQGKTVYSIDQLFVMIFLGTLSFCDTCTELESFWKSHIKLYRKIFGLETVPSHDTFRRILGLMDPEVINSLIVEAIGKCDSSLRKAMKLPVPKMRHLCVDGKEENGTGRQNSSSGTVSNRQVLNFYDSYNETCLYSEMIDDKTNEIPHAQKVLKLMDLHGWVVTFDAMNTQRDTVAAVCERGGEYVCGLKCNQPTLYETATGIFSGERLDGMRGTDAYCRTSEVAHNQLEEREYFIFPIAGHLKKYIFQDWAKSNALICHRKHTVDSNTGREREETRYYLSSLKDVNDAALFIRKHWSVENNLHWNLDTVLHEDMMTTMDKTVVRNRTIINKMCLSLYSRLQEMDGKKRISKKCMRKCFGWNFEEMMTKALIMLDPLALSRCLTITPRK